MKFHPPRYALRFLRWFCSEKYLEEIEGNMIELFELQSIQNPSKARRNFVWQVILHFRLDFIKSINPIPMISSGILRNYLKVAWRNMAQSRFFSMINLGGLTLGLISSLLILIWIFHEMSVDRMHQNLDQIYQVYTRTSNGGKFSASYNTSARLPAFLKEEIPGIETSTGYAKVLRLSQQGDTYETFKSDRHQYKMSGSRAGLDYFNMFSYPLLHGNPQDVLNSPDDIVISRRMANLFFGSPSQAMNQTLLHNNSHLVKVSGVFEDLPDNVSDHFDYLMNWDYWMENDQFKGNWFHMGTLTFVQLQEGVNKENVIRQMKNILNGPMGIQPEDDYQIELDLQPYRDRYLFSQFRDGYPSQSRMAYIKLMALVALLILIISGVNFANLSTARSLRRNKELAVRKISGATGSNIWIQFLIETFLSVSMALLLALSLVYILMPWFSTFTGNSYSLKMGWRTVWLLLALTSFICVISGSYPAMFANTIKLNTLLQGNYNRPINSKRRGMGLIVFQFALAIGLVISTIIITQQTRYFQKADIGYKRDQIIYFPVEGSLIQDYLTFKERANLIPGVKFIDRSSQTPHRMGFNGPFVNWEGKGEYDQVSFTPNSVGYDYLKLLDIELIEGRDFDQAFGQDSNAFIVSKLAVEQMGLSNPIGTPISIFGKDGFIIGVVQDFHTNSLHESMQPVILDIKETLNFGSVLVSLEAGRTHDALNDLQSLYSNYNPDFPFQYHFLDAEYESLYRSEIMVNKLSNVFGLLAIILSCLGLLGLSVFSAQQRTKEIGIRKVLGASIGTIVKLLSMEFLRQVVIAFIISAPIAWYLMHNWLERFAYRIDIAWWVFVFAGTLVALITILTVGIYSMHKALTNPIQSLNSE